MVEGLGKLRVALNFCVWSRIFVFGVEFLCLELYSCLWSCILVFGVEFFFCYEFIYAGFTVFLH